MSQKQLLFARYGPLAIVVALYCAASIPRLTSCPPPWADDAYFMAPGHSLLTRGIWGSAPMGGVASRWGGSRPDSCTYFQPPLFLLLVAASFKLFGFGLLQARLVSAALGLGTVVLTYGLALSLRCRPKLAGLAASLVATQPLFVLTARQTRPESAVTFFTLLGVLAFVRYCRESHRGWPALSGVAGGAALMSHYNGLFGCIALLLSFLFLCRERPMIRAVGEFVGGATAVCLPYLLYVMQDAGTGFLAFRAQIAVVGRAGSYAGPADFVSAEYLRYARVLYAYRFLPGLRSALAAGSVAVLVAGLCRREWRCRVLSLLICTHVVLLICPSTNKTHLYLAVLLPYMSVLLLVLVQDAWQAAQTLRPWWRGLGATVFAVAVLLLISANAAVWFARSNQARCVDLDSTVAELRRLIPTGSSVMGGYALWIGLTDFEFYDWRFRSFEDISETAPDIFIHNDSRIVRADVSELKARLDRHFVTNADLLGEVDGGGLGRLQVLRVRWRHCVADED